MPNTLKQASKDLADQVSQETSCSDNIDAILDRGSKGLASDKKSEAETLLEQEIEENSAEKLLKTIELTTSPEELFLLMQQYEELLVSWGEKISLLRSKKHLEEYLSIAAALSMFQKMLQNPNLLLSGKQIAEMLQNNLKTQQQSIGDNVQKIQAQNQKLHEKTQALTKQLSQTEQLLKTAIEALKKDPGKLSPEELQATLKQLQESLKKVQELKENALSGKQFDTKEMLESLKRMHEQNQKLFEIGKLGEAALQAMQRSQQSLQQTIQLANVIQQLQEHMTKLQVAPVGQIRQNAVSFITSQAPESGRITNIVKSVQSCVQIAVMTGQVVEAARHTSVVQQQATVAAKNAIQQAHQQAYVAEQVATRVQSVPNNVVQITSATLRR